MPRKFIWPDLAANREEPKMQERRQHQRESVDLPVTVRFSDHHAVVAKMVELSARGMGFLCPIAPEINSGVELRFSLPSRHTYELRFMANVRHSYAVQSTPGTPPDYRYVVGVNFLNPPEEELAILDEFLTQ